MIIWWHWGRKQNDRGVANDIFAFIFFNASYCIFIQITIELVFKSPINNMPILFKILSWCRKRRPDIIWIDGCLFYWRIYTSLNFDELIIFISSLCNAMSLYHILRRFVKIQPSTWAHYIAGESKIWCVVYCERQLKDKFQKMHVSRLILHFLCPMYWSQILSRE